MELCAPAVGRKKLVSTGGESQTAAGVVSRRNDTGTALNAFRDFCLEAQQKKDPTKSSAAALKDPVVDEEEEESIPDPCVPFITPPPIFTSVSSQIVS
jgi:hypothetical protein